MWVQVSWAMVLWKVTGVEHKCLPPSSPSSVTLLTKFHLTTFNQTLRKLHCREFLLWSESTGLILLLRYAYFRDQMMWKHCRKLHRLMMFFKRDPHHVMMCHRRPPKLTTFSSEQCTSVLSPQHCTWMYYGIFDCSRRLTYYLTFNLNFPRPLFPLLYSVLKNKAAWDTKEAQMLFPVFSVGLKCGWASGGGARSRQMCQHQLKSVSSHGFVDLPRSDSKSVYFT